MIQRHFLLSVTIIALALFGAVSAPTARAQGYTFYDLAPTGFVETEPTDISGAAAVGFGYGGSSTTNFNTHALRWSGTSNTAIDLNPSGFTNSFAEGISGSLIGGYGDNASTGNNYHALLWTGATASTAHDINPAGFIDSQAYAVSGNNLVGYGFASNSNTNDQALLWNWNGTSATATNLNPSTFISSEADSISGTTVAGFGVASAYSSNTHALEWTGSTASSYIDLNPNGFSNTFASSVYGSSIVGYGDGTATGGYTHAILWNASTGTYVDLDTSYLPTSFTSTYVNTFAVGISANGAIICYGQDANNLSIVAFELVPYGALPEPNTLLLLIPTSIAGLGYLIASRSVGRRRLSAAVPLGSAHVYADVFDGRVRQPHGGHTVLDAFCD